MKFSYARNLYCPKCKEEYEIDKVQNLCSCGSPLLVDYDLESLKEAWDKKDLEGRTNSLWRYHELLPVREQENIVTMGKG